MQIDWKGLSRKKGRRCERKKGLEANSVPIGQSPAVCANALPCRMKAREGYYIYHGREVVGGIGGSGTERHRITP
jgi:hypothetical protein